MAGQPPPQFFADCIFEGRSTYQTPESDADKDDARLDAFPLGTRGLDTPVDVMVSQPVDFMGRGPMGIQWDTETADLGFIRDGTEPKMFFAGVGFYNSPDTGDEDTKPQIEVAPQDLTQPSTRRPSSCKSISHQTPRSKSPSTGFTPPEDEDDDDGHKDDEEQAALEMPKKRRVVRRTRRDPRKVEDEQRRSKFLERNRIAASKCRQKKKQFVSKLGTQKTRLEAHHQTLQQQYGALMSEITSLKHQLMQHAKCNDERIDSWIENEARKFVANANDVYAQPWTPSYGALQPQLPAESPRTRNNSVSSTTYPTLHNGVAFDGGMARVAERQNSIAYSQAASSLFPSPTDETFPGLSMGLKREPDPDMNYDHMPDSMFNPDQPAYGAGP